MNAGRQAWKLLTEQAEPEPDVRPQSKDQTDQTADDADLNQMFDLDGAVQV